jgi:hypothetical protein
MRQQAPACMNAWHCLRKEISFSLIRGNFRMLKGFAGCFAREVGENFQQGALMPALDVEALHV